MKLKTIKIFISGQGIKELSRKEFIENLDYGLYDNNKIEILESTR